MTTAEINARFEELEALCDADERHDIAEQYRQWIYAAEERAAELQRRLDEIVEALEPSKDLISEAKLDNQANFELSVVSDLHARIKAIAEGQAMTHDEIHSLVAMLKNPNNSHHVNQAVTAIETLLADLDAIRAIVESYLPTHTSYIEAHSHMTRIEDVLTQPTETLNDRMEQCKD